MMADEHNIITPPIDAAAWGIGEAFLKGILLEVSSFPKPGLVCASSMGAHKDMDILTFMVSSAAIAPAFYLCAQAGRDHSGSLEKLLPVLRKIGGQYEERLLEATKGVNTQRGILFAAGILCGIAGVISQSASYFAVQSILSSVKEMTSGLVAKELGKIVKESPDLTAGEQLFLKYGITGIRREVEAGFPSIAEAGLPALRFALDFSTSLNECLTHTLLTLMTVVEDSTIVWRKGMGELSAVQASARAVLAKGSVFTAGGRQAIFELDKDFIARGISPGGSADLLAATIGIYLLENKQFPGKIL